MTGVKGAEAGGYVSFRFAKPETLLMKVAISYVSEEQARLNMAAELTHWDFDRVMNESFAEMERLPGAHRRPGRHA